VSGPSALAWLQLSRERLRFLVALLGVAFALLLIFVQLGFCEVLFESSVRYHEALAYGLALVSPETSFIGQTAAFSRRRLYQVRGHPGVASVTPVYVGQALWQNPVEPAQSRNIFVLGFDPARSALPIPGVEAQRKRIERQDTVRFDSASRPEFGPVPALLAERGALDVEAGGRRFRVAGLFTLGTSFGIDASLVTSDLNHQRLFPMRPPGPIQLGLVSLEAGHDPNRLRDELREVLPNDVLVLTRADFVAREIGYWNGSTPIGRSRASASRSDSSSAPSSSTRSCSPTSASTCTSTRP
jgi:putative ABC transport system permease protein